jgi:hypothetical protein
MVNGRVYGLLCCHTDDFIAIKFNGIVCQSLTSHDASKQSSVVLLETASSAVIMLTNSGLLELPSVLFNRCLVWALVSVS